MWEIQLFSNPFSYADITEFIDNFNKQFYSVDIMVIQDIQEVGQYMELKFQIQLEWVDARVIFYNLKMEQKLNSLSLEEQMSLWNPKLVFLNTKEELRTVNDETTLASVQRAGNGTIIAKTKNEDIETFLGSENPIKISRVYSIKFFCDYKMQWYPFDQQTCEMQLITDGVLDSYADLIPGGVNFTGPRELTQYYVMDFKMRRVKIRSKYAIVVSVTLGRRLLGITIFLQN